MSRLELAIPDPRKHPVPPGWIEATAPAILEATDWEWLDEVEARLLAFVSYVESFNGDGVEFSKALRVVEKRRGDLLPDGRGHLPRMVDSDASPATVTRWRKISRHWDVLWPIVRDAKSPRDVSQAALLREVRKLELSVSEAPSGLFSIVYADPPWQYGNTLDGYGPAEWHYPVLSPREICEFCLPDGRAVTEVSDPNGSVLFLWATSPQLDKALDVIEAWGFTYKTSFVWDKVKHNFGHYNSVRHELLLLSTRGSFTPQLERLKLYDSVVSIERGEHSAKPEFFRQMIDELYPNGRRLELFARSHIDGWETWGTE